MPIPLAGAILGAGALGAASSIWGGNKAADAQKDASNASIAEQQRQYNNSMLMYEPQRALGYGALADIAAMYGYSLPGYQSANQLLGPTGAGGSALNIYQGSASAGNANLAKGLGLVAGTLPGYLLGGAIDKMFGGKRDPQLQMQGNRLLFDGRKSGGTLHGGYIDLATGQVVVGQGTSPEERLLSEQATAAFRAGQPLEGGVWARFNNAINALGSSGYKWQDPATTPGAAGNVANSRLAGRNESAPGDMSRFFTSPDYQFRRDEGIRGIEQGAAARGGALSGNALRGVSAFNSNLASGEYGNYMNRLFSMAGLGQTATNNSVQAGQNYANNYSQAQQNIGDARASGVVSGITGATNAINSGLNNWLLYRGGYFNAPDPMSGLSPVNVWQKRI